MHPGFHWLMTCKVLSPPPGSCCFTKIQIFLQTYNGILSSQNNKKCTFETAKDEDLNSLMLLFLAGHVLVLCELIFFSQLCVVPQASEFSEIVP